MSEEPDWLTLTQDESVLWAGQPALTPYVKSSFGGIILVLIGLVILQSGGLDSLVGVEFDPEIGFLPVSFWTLLGLIFLIWGLLGILGNIIRWWSIRYVITSDELYKKTGLFARSVQNTRIEHVQNTSFNQSLFGRLAGYGDILIYTAGSGGIEMIFRHATKPDELVEKITRQLDQESS